MTIVVEIGEAKTRLAHTREAIENIRALRGVGQIAPVTDKEILVSRHEGRRT